MSDGYCVDICNSQYAFAIIQGQDCYCSNAAPAVQYDTGYCNYPCPGYPADPCGNVTDNYYAYFNLNRAASTTISGTAVVTSSDVIVATSGTAASSSANANDGSTTDAAAASQTSTSLVTTDGSLSASTVFTATGTSAIEQYIQTALAAAAIGAVSTEACFVNQAYSSFTTPSWFANAPTQVQSYYSSVNLGSTAACTATPSHSAGAAVTSGKSSGLSAGAKAGIAIGAILGALLIAALIVFAVIFGRRRKRRQEEKDVAGTMPSEKSSYAPYAAHDVHDVDAYSAPNDAPSIHYGSEQPIYPDNDRVPSAHAMSAAQGAWQNQNRAPVAVLHEAAIPRATTANALVTAADKRRNQSFERAVATHGAEAGSSRSSEYGTPPDGSHAGGPGRYADMQHDFPVPPRPDGHQNAFALQQQNPYQMHPNWAQELSGDSTSVPRKPVGSTSRFPDIGTEDMTALPPVHDPENSQHIGQAVSNGQPHQPRAQTSFYDDNDDEYYPYHAR